MGEAGIEQRQHPRYRTRLFGVFRRDIELDETETLMMNLSLGGAFVKSEEPCAPGTPITLRFYLDEASAPVSVNAEVAWWRRGVPGGAPAGMGLKFLQVADADQRRLREYLARLVEEDLFGG